MAHLQIRPGTSPKSHPTLPTPTRATCSTICRRGRHARVHAPPLWTRAQLPLLPLCTLLPSWRSTRAPSSFPLHFPLASSPLHRSRAHKREAAMDAGPSSVLHRSCRSRCPCAKLTPPLSSSPRTAPCASFSRLHPWSQATEPPPPSLEAAGVRGQGATAHVPDFRDHQRARADPLVLPRHFFVAGVQPNSRKTRVRAPPLF